MVVRSNSFAYIIPNPKMKFQGAILLASIQGISAFAPASFVPHATGKNQLTYRAAPSVSSSCTSLNQASIGDQCLLTPEGFGFTSSAERILKETHTGESSGFAAVNGNDSVIDVMQTITSGEDDVALVYDGTDLLGIFTESDYINVSHCCMGIRGEAFFYSRQLS